MKKIVITALFLLLFSINVCAQDAYTEQYEISGAEDIYGYLDEEARGFFDRLELDIGDSGWVGGLTAENIFEEIIGFLKDGMKTPLKCAAGLLALIVLLAAANTFEGFKPFEEVASYIFVLVAATGVLLPLFSLIENCGSAVKGVGTLMLGFIPIYAGILTVGGQGITASGMSFLLLGAAGAVGNIASFIVVPLMSGYLGVGLVSSVLPVGSANRLGEALKKTAMWILSLSLTLFLGLLSIQTAVNAAADNLGVKTVKFVLGSFVPVAGGALSESLTTLLGSVKLLKSSVGMFGVLGVAVTVLPVIIELLIWRVMLFFLLAAAELFGIQVKTDILKAADCVISVLIGVLLFVASLFIISLGVVLGG